MFEVTPRLIDTHAHVNFNRFKEDYKQVLDDCLAKETWVVNIGSQYETSSRAVEIAEEYKAGVYAVVGLHPIHLFSQHVDVEETSFESRQEDFDYEKYRKLAQSPKVVGIGECGLEYFRLPEGQEEQVKQKQQEVFIQQIDLATRASKVLMVHSRDSSADICKVLKEHIKKVPAAIIHSFIGNWEEAKPFLDLGCYFSFNGIITYKPRKERKPGESDPNLLEAVKLIPLDKILLETDCPYLAPQSVRGTRNLPVNVKYVAEKIAEIKGLAVEEVARVTTETARKLFEI